jgi:hypothetical protein
MKKRDVPTVLYTMGPQFEQFLTGKELQAMSSVSQATRSGMVASKFRELLNHVNQEFQVHRTNKKGKAGDLNYFMKKYPLRTIFKNYPPTATGEELSSLIDYLRDQKKIDYVTSVIIKTELGDIYNDEFKQMIVTVKEISNIYKQREEEYERSMPPRSLMFRPGETISSFEAPDFGSYEKSIVSLAEASDFSLSYIYLNLITNLSKRLNANLVELLYKDTEVNFSFAYVERDYYYPITKELRDVYIKYEPELAHLHTYYIDETGVDFPDDMFGLVNVDWDRSEIFLHTLDYAQQCLDWDLFKAYMSQYNKLIKYERLLKLIWSEDLEKAKKDTYFNYHVTLFVVNRIIPPEWLQRDDIVKFINENGDNYAGLVSLVAQIPGSPPNISAEDLEIAYAEAELGLEMPTSFEQLFHHYETRHKYTEPIQAIKVGVEIV